MRLTPLLLALLVVDCGQKKPPINVVGHWKGSMGVGFNSERTEVFILDILPNKRFNMPDMKMEGTWKLDDQKLSLTATMTDGVPMKESNAFLDDLLSFDVSTDGKRLKGRSMLKMEFEKIR